MLHRRKRITALTPSVARHSICFLTNGTIRLSRFILEETMRSARLAGLIIPISLLITVSVGASEPKGPAAFLAVQRDQNTTASDQKKEKKDLPLDAARTVSPVTAGGTR